jgi:hypothetical protein
VDVELHKLVDLHHAMRLARVFEHRNTAKSPVLPAAPPCSSRRAMTGQLGGTSSPASSIAQSSSRPFRYLTPSKMAKCRK